MRFKFWFVVFVSLTMTACAGSLTLAPTPPAATSIKIRVGSDASLPPFESPTADPKVLTGFDIELFQTIAARAGWQAEFLNVGMSALLPFVARCQVDAGISMIAITPNLSQQMLFSDPYYSTANVVVVKKGNLTLNDASQLAGKNIGTETGSPGEKEVEKIPYALPRSYKTFLLAFQDLALGEIDAVISDKARAQYYASIKPNGLKIVGADLERVDFGIAVCKDKPDVLQQVNAGLAGIQADGTLNRLKQKWNISGN